MDEVAGSAGVYVDPENPETAAASAILALQNAADLRQRSVKNAARFSGAAMVSRYVSLYEKVRSESCASSCRN
jgi:hypothetical protein